MKSKLLLSISIIFFFMLTSISFAELSIEQTAIGGIKIGDKMSKVIKIYGQPKVGDSVQEMINAYGNTDSKHSDNGFEYYFYGVVTDDSLLQLIFKAKDNVIVEIHSTTN